MTATLTRLCDTPGCDAKHYAKGLCQREYARAYQRLARERVEPAPPRAPARVGPRSAEQIRRDHRAAVERARRSGWDDAALRLAVLTGQVSS